MEDIRVKTKQRILTTKEVSEMLNITRQGVFNRVKENELIPIKVTSHGLLFDKEDIEQYQRKKKRIYSEIITIEELGYIVTHNKNILIYGPIQSGKSYLLNNIIHSLLPILFFSNKKINVSDPYNDELCKLNKIINVYNEVDEKFFLHISSIIGAMATIQSDDEISAIKEFALQINKPVEYVLKNIDYVIKIDTILNQNFLINNKSIRKLLTEPNLCIYNAISKLPSDKPYFTYYYEQ